MTRFSRIVFCASLLAVAAPVPHASAQNALQRATVDRIKKNQLTFGTWIYLNDPSITELMSRAGFDWMIFDNEHGHLNEGRIQELIMPLNGTKTVSLGRVTLNELSVINKMLSTGVMGIVVPSVSTKADAQRAADAVFYPPMGKRDVGHARSTGWGQIKNQSIAHANESMILFVIIETHEGVTNIEEILSVPGISVVLVGTHSLAGTMGLPGLWAHPKVVAAKDKVEAACRARGIAYASWANDRAGIQEAIKSGSRMVALGGDADFIWTTSESLLDLGATVAGEMKENAPANPRTKTRP